MNLVDRVREFLNEKCKMLETGFYSDIISNLEEATNLGESIESPIEQLFFIEWKFRQFCNSELELLYLEPQYSDPSTKNFILDFYINIIEEVLTWKEMFDLNKYDIITSTPYPKVGIEIDSHIWHEKSKEQAMKDKKRERILIANGWQLLRFAGSEVYKDPARCVDETLGFVLKIREKYFKELREKFKDKKVKT